MKTSDDVGHMGCRICPQQCGTDRTGGDASGVCGVPAMPRVNRVMLHHWEEPVLSGSGGSGTIFFASCNLRCVYCQNHRISQERIGEDRSPDEVAAAMLRLQADGAHNVNLVTPTQFTPMLRAAIVLARARGLRVPVVWNSNAYELPETLRQLAGLVDIYLPDFRYFDEAAAVAYSAAPGYPEVAKAAIREMFRQVGHLVVGDDGLATRGLLVRLLVLPGNVNRVDGILRWLAREIGPETHISLMGQYYPAFRAGQFPELARPLCADEYEPLVDLLAELGMENGFVQEVGSDAGYTPDFG